MRLEGKVALITGTAGGIGRATALCFAQEGARIVAVDIVAANHETVELIRAAGGEATAVRADVSDDADVAAAVTTAEQTYGRLDIAFNNAGIMLADDSDSISTPEQTIDKTLAVNLKGVLYGCRHQIPAMRRAGADCVAAAEFDFGCDPFSVALPDDRVHFQAGVVAVVAEFSSL